MRGFILGVIVTLACIVGGAYLLLRSGKASLATTAQPLPLEQTVARMALDASIGSAKDQVDPLPHNDDNMLAGVKVYKGHCIFCHGAPDQLRPPISTMMFPHPPQLFTKDDRVTDDPEGATFWKVTNGIRLSGMPGFGDHLSENERWQVTMLLAHADKLPPSAQAAFARKEMGEPTMHADHEHEHMHEHEQ